MYDVINDEAIGPGFTGAAYQDGSVQPYVASWIKLLDAPAKFGRSLNVRHSPLGVIEVLLTYFIDLDATLPIYDDLVARCQEADRPLWEPRACARWRCWAWRCRTPDSRGK
jgi:hypothetical protein